MCISLSCTCPTCNSWRGLGYLIEGHNNSPLFQAFAHQRIEALVGELKAFERGQAQLISEVAARGQALRGEGVKEGTPVQKSAEKKEESSYSYYEESEEEEKRSTRDKLHVPTSKEDKPKEDKTEAPSSSGVTPSTTLSTAAGQDSCSSKPSGKAKEEVIEAKSSPAGEGEKKPKEKREKPRSPVKSSKATKSKPASKDSEEEPGKQARPLPSSNRLHKSPGRAGSSSKATAADLDQREKKASHRERPVSPPPGEWTLRPRPPAFPPPPEHRERLRLVEKSQVGRRNSYDRPFKEKKNKGKKRRDRNGDIFEYGLNPRRKERKQKEWADAEKASRRTWS